MCSVLAWAIKHTKNLSASGITFKNKILEKIRKYSGVRSPINFLSLYGSDKKIYSENLVVFEKISFFLFVTPLVQNKPYWPLRFKQCVVLTQGYCIMRCLCVSVHLDRRLKAMTTSPASRQVDSCCWLPGARIFCT